MIDLKLLENIETPALIIDMQIVRENLKEYQCWCDRYGVKIRPHTKTHKIPELAKLQMEYGAEGIIVAKTSEAEVMAEAGIQNILVGYPIYGKTKIRRLAALNKKISKLYVSLDNLEAAKQFSEVAVETGKEFTCVCDVDVSNLGRAGFVYDRAVDEICQAAKLPGLNIVGVWTYAYLILPDRSQAIGPQEAGQSEGRRIVAIAEKLRERGLDIQLVAGGSSPTGRWVATVPGVTEVHPGGYIYNDQMSWWFINNDQERCAASVLTTVVSMHDWRATVDLGTKSLCTDMQGGALEGRGLGWIYNKPQLRLEVMAEEHGVIVNKDYDRSIDKGSSVTDYLKLGERIRIIPNHCCPTVALHDFCYFVDGDQVRKVDIPCRGCIT